jgi:hypothetical protein
MLSEVSQGSELPITSIFAPDVDSNEGAVGVEVGVTTGEGLTVEVEVTTGEGLTHEYGFSSTDTVSKVKLEVERNLGIRPRDARLFFQDELREEELRGGESLQSLCTETGSKVKMTLLVVLADAQQIVAELVAKANLVLGLGVHFDHETNLLRGHADDQLADPMGVAFVPAYPDLLVITEDTANRMNIRDIHSGALICQFGEPGEGNGQFLSPGAAAVTADSSLVLIAEFGRHRVQVLKLHVEAGGSRAQLKFSHFIGDAKGLPSSDEGGLNAPFGMALLPCDGGQETVLVTEEENHRVSQFALDGTFIRIFAGSGIKGSGDGELNGPDGITVLGTSGEVAVTDYHNNRVQIFDAKGRYVAQFGNGGTEADGTLIGPTSIASDVHGNLLVTDKTIRLQVFSREGKHLCTRNDLGLNDGGIKCVAWSADGDLAIANGSKHTVHLWRGAT